MDSGGISVMKWLIKCGQEVLVLTMSVLLSIHMSSCTRSESRGFYYVCTITFIVRTYIPNSVATYAITHLSPCFLKEDTVAGLKSTPGVLLT